VFSRLEPLRLLPEYRAYVWGGNRLRPGEQTAEAWVLFEGNRIADGDFAGQTLAQASAALGEDLLGSRVMAAHLGRFPLLIKLLDCAAWLSLQVHPNDTQAVELEGPGQNGKTEAWYILQADPGAKIIAGMKPGVSAPALAQALRDGSLLEQVQFSEVHAGDTVFMPAGTIHALGPGLLVYEVQQVSDITYRVFDWNRPQTAGRALHIEKSLAVADPAAAGRVIPARPSLKRQTLVACPYFTLDLLDCRAGLALSTGGESFHALTAIEGNIELHTPGGMCSLKPYESVLIPAACRKYNLTGQGRVLLARAG
jgi:mannose-6-phosphate isomerase